MSNIILESNYTIDPRASVLLPTVAKHILYSVKTGFEEHHIKFDEAALEKFVKENSFIRFEYLNTLWTFDFVQ